MNDLDRFLAFERRILARMSTRMEPFNHGTAYFDDDPWLAAELAPQDTTDTWRQWRLAWDATSGEHRIAVRATDRDGVVQTPDLAEPYPDGATGYHTVSVSVR